MDHGWDEIALTTHSDSLNPPAHEEFRPCSSLRRHACYKDNYSLLRGGGSWIWLTTCFMRSNWPVW